MGGVGLSVEGECGQRGLKMGAGSCLRTCFLGNE